MKKPVVFILLGILWGLAPARADSAPGAIYLILDGSGSMWQKLPDQTFKIEAAKSVLREFVQKDFSGYELAFRVYGHRRKDDCTDSELIVPFGAPAAVIPKLQAFMDRVNPTGKTPITYSLRQALSDFGDRSGEIILISDGIETCDEDPCALVRAWQEKNVALKVHVVGLGLDEKSKNALQCISEAAGTEYHDANSAGELAESLSEIQSRTVKGALVIRAQLPSGKAVKVFGFVSPAGGEEIPVESHYRNSVNAGDYDLTVGIRTANGNLYQPIVQQINVAETGETTVNVTVPEPPTVKAKFVEAGKTQRGSQVTAYQDGQKVFQFRWMDEVFVDEGTYEFRARPNPENELSVTETFAAGDHKEIVFEMVQTVRVKLKLIASGSGIWFRENYELWQDGEKKYPVHVHNGAQVRPGRYDVHLPNKITPFVKKDVVITTAEEQNIEIVVPCGHVTFVYQKPDGTRDEDKRCFVGRGPTQKGKFHNSGQKYPFTPGTYNVVGWRGKYDRVVFEIREGEEKEVVLRAKE